MERRLIVDYERTVDRLLEHLGLDKLADAAGIAAMPLDIRGIGLVKTEAAERIGTEMQTKLDEYRAV